MFNIFKIILILFVILIGLMFHLRNDQLVVIDYYSGDSEIPLSLVIAGSLFLGAILGALSCLPTLIKLKRGNAKLVKQVKTNEKALNKRVLPANEKNQSVDDPR